jgi:hypothetical protein
LVRISRILTAGWMEWGVLSTWLVLEHDGDGYNDVRKHLGMHFAQGCVHQVTPGVVCVWRCLHLQPFAQPAVLGVQLSVS